MSKQSLKIIELAQKLGTDENEFYDKENNSAGTRARKTLQEIIVACRQARAAIITVRKSKKAA